MNEFEPWVTLTHGRSYWVQPGDPNIYVYDGSTLIGFFPDGGEAMQPVVTPRETNAMLDAALRRKA